MTFLRRLPRAGVALKLPTAPFRLFSADVIKTQKPTPPPKAVKDAWKKKYEPIIAEHPAADHELFRYVAERAKSGTLTGEQFKTLREIMFSRIYPTLGNIFKHGRIAADEGDYQTLKTIIKNIGDEGAKGNVPNMHPVLLQEAFNRVANEIFGLPEVRAETCYNNPKYPSQVTYRTVVNGLYEQGSAVAKCASYIQERMSGGDGETNPGMMGHMYAVFLPYKDRLSKATWQKVLQYFEAHIVIDPQTSEQILDPKKATELKHAERAKEDLLRLFETPEQIEKIWPWMNAWANAQSGLFKEALDALRKQEPIKAPPALPTSQVRTAAPSSSHSPKDCQSRGTGGQYALAK